MARKTKTGFNKYVEQQMKDPEFATAYRLARAEIDATDVLIRALDAARKRNGVSKAALARRIETKPETVRRLLTDEKSNPTMKTVFKIAGALGYHFRLVPNEA